MEEQRQTRSRAAHRRLRDRPFSEIGRETQRVIERAEIVKHDDRITPEEQRGAREIYPDLRLGPGLGESFIAGKELRDRYNFGEPAMRAVVRAANDWRRTGFTAPIRRDDLFDLFKRQLKELAPLERQTEEVFNAGLEEACRPVALYSALLNIWQDDKSEERYYVVDYVSDYLGSEGPAALELVWKLALARPQSECD
jgi:hypothetical protein